MRARLPSSALGTMGSHAPALTRISGPWAHRDTGTRALGLQRPEQVELPPEIPARDRSIGPPRLAELEALAGPGQVVEAVDVADRRPDAQVVDRQHIRAVQAKDEEHLGGPDADPLDRGQPGHDGCIVEVVERVDR